MGKWRFTLWLCKITIENGNYNGFSHEKWWFSIAMLNYQRVPSGVISHVAGWKPWTIESSVIFLARNLSSGIFQPAMFDCQRVPLSTGIFHSYAVNMLPIPGSSRDAGGAKCLPWTLEVSLRLWPSDNLWIIYGSGWWYTYPSEKIWVRHLGLWNPQWKNWSHVPNHKPEKACQVRCHWIPAYLRLCKNVDIPPNRMSWLIDKMLINQWDWDIDH